MNKWKMVMQKVKRKTRQYMLVVAGVLCVAFGLPIIWHRLGFDANGATDYLAYVGSLVGAFTALAAVSLQIRADAKARREEYEQSTKPIIWLGVDDDFEVHRTSMCEMLEMDAGELLEQQGLRAQADLDSDKRRRRSYVILSEDGGEYHRTGISSSNLDKDLCLKTHSKSYYCRDNGGRVFNDVSPYLVIPFVVRNVGVGPALNFREGTRFSDEKEGRCFNKPRVLGVGDEVRFVICVDTRSDWDSDLRFDVTATYETVTGQTLRSAFAVVAEVCSKNNKRGYRVSMQSRVETVQMDDALE